MKYRLKEFRQNENIKQEVIADILNMTRANYSRLENEQIVLSMDGVIKIANFYDASLDYLAKRDNHSKNESIKKSIESIKILIGNIEKNLK